MGKKTKPENLPQQWVSAGKNANVAGRDNNQNILSGNMVSLVLCGIVALGGLGWLLGIRLQPGQNGMKIQIQNQQ